MNSLHQLVLNKLGQTDKPAAITRAAVPAGKYGVSMLVSITGTVTVGDDYTTAPTVSIPLIETLALMVKRAGFTRERSMAIIRECVTEALLAGKAGGQGAIEANVPEVAAWIEQVKEEVIAQLPRATRTGPVTKKLEIALVPHAPITADTVTPEPIATEAAVAS